MSRQTSFKAMYEIVSTYYDYKFEVVDYAVTHTEVWQQATVHILATVRGKETNIVQEI